MLEPLDVVFVAESPPACGWHAEDVWTAGTTRGRPAPGSSHEARSSAVPASGARLATGVDTASVPIHTLWMKMSESISNPPLPRRVGPGARLRRLDDER
ncbi:hypothetical protein M3T53_02495 [Actinomyces sp. B33]|nr:hypothetical protein [Actinomyces sp. B33]